MTISFNSALLPHPETEDVFGLVHTSYSPLQSLKYEHEVDHCKTCDCILFPTKDNKIACPICSPEADFCDGSFKVGEGNERKTFYVFIFDMFYSIEQAQALLHNFAESMQENDSAIIIGLSQGLHILYSDNEVPQFVCFSEKDFTPSITFESKKAVIESVLIPSLPALYNVFPVDPQLKIDVTFPLRVAMLQSDRRLFSVLFLIKREVEKLTAEKAAFLSRKIATEGGIVNFGAPEGFRRLSAISRLNFGCVFGISEFVPSFVSLLFAQSRTSSFKMIAPRFIEISKVTGCDGNLNMTSYVTKANLTSVKGFSVRMSIDYSRIEQTHERIVRIVEITKNIFGKFVTLHTFKWSESSDYYVQAMEPKLTRNLILKAFASDVLREAWQGGDLAQIIRKHVNDMNKSAVNTCCSSDIGSKSDRDCLKLYFILHCMCSDMINEISATNDGYIFITPPVVFIYSATNDFTAFLSRIQSEWPFEIRVFNDLSAFRILIEKHNCQLPNQ